LQLRQLVGAADETGSVGRFTPILCALGATSPVAAGDTLCGSSLAGALSTARALPARRRTLVIEWARIRGASRSVAVQSSRASSSLARREAAASSSARTSPEAVRHAAA